MGRHLLEQGDNITHPGITLPGTGSLAITFDQTGTGTGDFNELSFLVLSGATTSVNIASTGFIRAISGAGRTVALPPEEDIRWPPCDIEIGAAKPATRVPGMMGGSKGRSARRSGCPGARC